MTALSKLFGINKLINASKIGIKTGEKKYTTLDKYLNKKTEDVYSSQEVKTNKVWVDENGKRYPVYRTVLYKKFELPTQNNVTSYVIEHGIQNIKEAISCVAYNDAGTRLPFISYGQGFTAVTAFNSINIEIRYFKDSWSLRTWTITCEYTKTTD